MHPTTHPPIQLISSQDPSPTNPLVLSTLLSLTSFPPSSLTPPQSLYIFHSLKQLPHISRLLQHTDKDSIKSLLKSSNIIHLNPNNILFSSLKKSDYYYILIKGKVQITSSEQKPLDDHLVGGLLFDMIFQFAQIKTKHSNDSIKSKLQQKQYSIRIIQQHQQPFGDDIYQLHKVRSYQAKAILQSYLLQIPLTSYIHIYKIYNDRRIQSIKQLFRKFRSFDILEDKMLVGLIKECQEVTKGKREIVYQEGERVVGVYVLKRGEVEITKRVQHGERQDGKRSSREMDNSLYSSPEKKQQSVVISILSNQNMFGQQDITSPFCTTTARVISSSATYYSLSIQKLQLILKRQHYTLNDFNSYLELKSSKKRSYHQSRFCQVMNIRKRVNSGMDRLGNQIVSLGKYEQSQNSMVLSRLLFENKARRESVRERERDKDKERESVEKKGTELNLSVLLTRSKIQVYQQLNIPSTSRKRRLKSASPFQPSNNLSQDHQSQKSKALLINNNRISLDNPLFELNYFKDFEKEKRRRIRDSNQKMQITMSRTRTLSRKKKIFA